MKDMTGPVNVLLVDDLDENLLALEALLQRDGLVCLKAHSGEEALELLLVHNVALALLDVQMPGMDGFQLAEFMRGSERARHIPIIFVTAGSADNRRRFRGYEAGAVDFIQKPIEPDVLRSKASVFFDLYQQRQQIQAQRDELSAYAEELRTVDRRKTEFIAMLAHELRNPIMAFSGGARLLKKQRDPAQAEEIRERMERQAFHLSRLIEDLTDISRIGQGKISLRPERIDLQTIVKSALETSQTQIDSAGHNLTLDLPEHTVWLHADQTRIAQVVSNLLNNAAKYTPPGGKITVTARADVDVVTIVVSDNGIGVPADMQSRIFEIFTQVQTEDARPQAGLGIGLALVKQLVQLHGGSVTVASEGTGKGSAFAVQLPALEAVTEKPIQTGVLEQAGRYQLS
jgi:signal transduction histidine kinase